MTGRPLIAVTQRVDDYPDRPERRDALDQALIRWLAAAGFTGMPVSNAWSSDELTAWLGALNPAGVVLSGGNDIGTCADRDTIEHELIDWAMAAGRPVLGICRGMQMLAVAAGEPLKSVTGHVRTRHQLGVPFGEVNSFHDSTLAGLPDGYDLLARSEDGEVEAMRHRTHPIEGWMWHPEREVPFDPVHLDLARRHFLQATQRTS